MLQRTLSIACCVVFAAGTAAAAVIHVPADWLTIQEAIVNSVDGDEIVVSPGTYVSQAQIISLGPRIIRSEAGPAVTTITANGVGTPFTVTSSTDIVIQGFTITQGIRGIRADLNTRLVIDGNVIAGNTSPDDGAGIWAVRSSATITKNRIADNIANHTSGFDGGGIYAYSLTGSIRDNVFENNTGADGGAMIITETSPSLAVAHNLFLNNHARNGGAILVYFNVNPDLSNNTFVGNTASTAGGAIWYIGGGNSLVLRNNILARNTAPVGGGIFAFSAIPVLQIGCNDAWSNAGGNYAGAMIDPTGSGGNVSLDPEFCDADGGNYFIHDTSPCAPAHSNGCDLIGAFGVFCGLVSVESADWSTVKRMYR